MKLKSSFTLFFAFTTFLSFGQFIHPIVVIPANPTPADQVKLVFTVSTGGQGEVIEFVSQLSGNVVSAAGCYFHGFLASPKTYRDTVSLGQLAVGMYQVNFIANGSWDQQQCIPSGQGNGITTFNVGQVAGTQAELSRDVVKVHPNPNSGNLITITHRQPIIQATIFDLTGNKIQTYINREGKEVLNLNIQNLPRGIYLILTESHGKLTWNRLIRN